MSVETLPTTQPIRPSRLRVAMHLLYFYGMFAVITVFEGAFNSGLLRLTSWLHLPVWGGEALSWTVFLFGGVLFAIPNLKTVQAGEKFHDPIVGGSAKLWQCFGWVGFFVGSVLSASMGMAAVAKAKQHPHPVRVAFMASACFATFWVVVYTHFERQIDSGIVAVWHFIAPAVLTIWHFIDHFALWAWNGFALDVMTPLLVHLMNYLVG